MAWTTVERPTSITRHRRMNASITFNIFLVSRPTRVELEVHVLRAGATAGGSVIG